MDDIARHSWGLPDWRKPDDYPSDPETTDRVWKWEFTRRRPDYRKLWTDGILHQTIQSDTIMAVDHVWLQLHFSMSRILDPTKQFSDQRLWQHSFPINRVEKPIPNSPPDESNLDYFVDDLRFDYLDRQNQKANESEKGLVRYTFDLSSPIGPQIKKAADHLKSLQSDDVRPKRPRMFNWHNFLRALDARECGATFQSIADTIWSGQDKTAQSARDTYEAALHLRDNFPL